MAVVVVVVVVVVTKLREMAYLCLCQNKDFPRGSGHLCVTLFHWCKAPWSTAFDCFGNKKEGLVVKISYFWLLLALRKTMVL